MSNETPKPSHEKTKSAHSSLHSRKVASLDTESSSSRAPRVSSISFARVSVPLLIVCLCVVAVLGIMLSRPHDTAASYVVMAGKRYTVEVARSQAEQERGLGGRSTLAPYGGMLFVFDKPLDQCFWMKDMLFSIDILWLSEKGKVITLAPSVAPDTYPNDFCPDVPAKYVLEVAAGEAARQGVNVNDTVQIHLMY